MFRALSAGDNYGKAEVKKSFSRFKLFGLVLHDPKTNADFHREMSARFELLDYLTGANFLFFTLTDAPENWRSRISGRDYYNSFRNPINLNNLYIEESVNDEDDNSISAFTIAKGLQIDYADLPVIILTDDLEFKKFCVLKTCPHHLEDQMKQLGYFASKKEKGFDIYTDPDFQSLIRNIDKCGGSVQINAEESLAQTLSDFFAFAVQNVPYSRERFQSLDQIKIVLDKFLSVKESNRDPGRLEQLNLFLLGCISNLSKASSKPRIKIHPDCESESHVILLTFNKVLPLFEPPGDELQKFDITYKTDEIQQISRLEIKEKLDYSPLILSLSKIFEIETNLSLVQWFRESVDIQMPNYFNKRANNRNDYVVRPSPLVVPNPRPIDLNMGRGTNWRAPGLGDTEVITRSFLFEKKGLPNEITDYDDLLENWSVLRSQRNRAAHSEYLLYEDFKHVYNAFNNIVNRKYLSQFVELKNNLRSPI